jgi:UDP:flavonoid glycosyltransferase YjiC (YdhE family)
LKILLTVNTVWNIVNFRLNLIRALRQAGWDVITAAPPDSYVEKLSQLDIPFHPIPIQNMGTDPLEDLKLWWDYYKLIKREKPNVVLSFTVKPNIYGGMAARILGIPYFPNVAGLGTAFIRTGWITWIVKHLYRLMLNGANTVFFSK